MAMDQPSWSTAAPSSNDKGKEKQLVDPSPCSEYPARVGINHLQLRNLLVTSLPATGEASCAGEYAQDGDTIRLYSTLGHSLIEHAIIKGHSPEPISPNLASKLVDTSGTGVRSSQVVLLPFQPVCLALASMSVHLPPVGQASSSKIGTRTRVTLLLSGGQNADLHLSLYTPTFSSCLWSVNLHLKERASINNSVHILVPRHLSPYEEDWQEGDKAEPSVVRFFVPNNDYTIKFFSVDIGAALALASSQATEASSDPKLANDSDEPIRYLYDITLESAVNYATPDSSHTTLVSLTDSNHIYIHSLPPIPHSRRTVSSSVSAKPELLRTLYLPFSPCCPAALTLPAPPGLSRHPIYTPEVFGIGGQISPHPFLTDTGPYASFAAGFSSDGRLFGVGSQSGVVGVWDARSSTPIWTYITPRPTVPYPTMHTVRQKHAPGYGIRTLKFGRGASSGLLAFCEHSRRVHIVDTRTFETHQILELPRRSNEEEQIPDPTAVSAAGEPLEGGYQPGTRRPQGSSLTRRPRARRQSAILVSGSAPPTLRRSPSRNRSPPSNWSEWDAARARFGMDDIPPQGPRTPDWNNDWRPWERPDGAMTRRVLDAYRAVTDEGATTRIRRVGRNAGDDPAAPLPIPVPSILHSARLAMEERERERDRTWSLANAALGIRWDRDGTRERDAGENANGPNDTPTRRRPRSVFVDPPSGVSESLRAIARQGAAARSARYPSLVQTIEVDEIDELAPDGAGGSTSSSGTTSQDVTMNDTDEATQLVTRLLERQRVNLRASRAFSAFEAELQARINRGEGSGSSGSDVQTMANSSTTTLEADPSNEDIGGGPQIPGLMEVVTEVATPTEGQPPQLAPPGTYLPWTTRSPQVLPVALPEPADPPLGTPPPQGFGWSSRLDGTGMTLETALSAQAFLSSSNLLDSGSGRRRSREERERDRERERERERERARQEEEVDIAGFTWSPTGESLFVATTNRIFEWRVREDARTRPGLQSVWEWR